ncbi:hypothetical protein [Saccharothrix deserti]|uniref:hypothetical protein n=1 Tax=Saccharothrix deserti TaxID=2593674 RepID=UPI00131E9ABA|nr:hypothetical protein [Saccharothrix deserti]
MRFLIKALTSAALTVAAVVGVGASPALAATGYDVYEQNDVGTKHARAWGSITWTGARSFNIARANLADLACDNQPVYWFIDVDGRWTGQERHMNSGCHTETYWTNVHASDSFNIRRITIWVCRDTLFPECDAKAYSNPNV